MTPTDRLSGFGIGLATYSDSVERVPRGHLSQYSDPNGSAHASFFRSLATRHPPDARRSQSRALQPHTNRLTRMVTTADRSPARYIFELKLAEVPSGPLNSKRCFARDPGHLSTGIARTAVSASCDYRRGFLRSRLVPARFRSRTTRMAEAWSMARTKSLRGRPGGRRVRLKASRSFGRIAHTIPTLIPYRRCRSSIRCT